MARLPGMVHGVVVQMTTPAPSSAGSSVVVGLSRLGPEAGVRGKGTLCTLSFTAVGEGDAQLAFSRASVRDPENRALDAVFRSTKLVVR